VKVKVIELSQIFDTVNTHTLDSCVFMVCARELVLLNVVMEL